MLGRDGLIKVFDWLTRKRAVPVKSIAQPSPTTARVFISSTFQDMQRERDILAHAVFPRLRSRMARSGTAIFEVDLRWGILEEEALNKRAVRLCLEEIDNCYPLFMGMLGERYGWRPAWTELDGFELAGLSEESGPPPSVTEMEVRRAMLLASSRSHKGPAPFFLFRSKRLSEEAGSTSDVPEAMASLKAFIQSEAHDLVVEYDNFESFETQAEHLLSNALAEWRANPVNPRNPPQAELGRADLMALLTRATKRARPVVLTGDPGSGISFLGRRWLAQAGDSGILIDARAIPHADLAQHLIDARLRLDLTQERHEPRPLPLDEELDRLMSALEHAKTGKGRVFIDHFEEAHASDARTDLTDLPETLPGKIELLVSTRSSRLLESARARRFDVVSTTGLSQLEREDFVRGTLRVYGKRLTPEQERSVTGAAFAHRVGALALCLDELRRHGHFESLDDRIVALIRCLTDDELAHDVLQQLSKGIPPRFSSALDRVLVALGMSVRGLQEDELIHAASQGLDALPPYVWSTIRVGLGRAILWRGSRVDLAPGPVRRIAEALTGQRPDLTQNVSEALLAHLQVNSHPRWVEEAPQILLVAYGEARLQEHLSRVEHVSQLLDMGRNYAVGWLERLSSPSRQLVCEAWVPQITRTPDAPNGLAWELGNVAAQLGASRAAGLLFDIDSRDSLARPNREVLEVLALKSAAPPKSLAAIAHWPVPAIDSDNIRGVGTRDRLAQIWTQSATVLALLTEGLIADKPERMQAWCSIAIDSTSALGDASARAQAYLLAGQVDLGLAQWRSAAARFDRAARLARRCGNARRLVSALERGATAALELQHFKQARSLASECLTLARQCALFEYECLAFERLIEVERRRANWEMAFSLVEHYLARAKATGLNVERAQACLSSLEP